jgi:hypothetical protein
MNDSFQGNGADVLFKGDRIEANESGPLLDMDCAVCKAPLVAHWPYVTCSEMDAEIVGDAIEVLSSDCWFTLCLGCSGSYDLKSFRPCVKKGKGFLPAAEVVDPGDWMERLVPPEVVSALDSFRYGEEDENGREVVSYTECTICADLIYEKTPFKVFAVSVETQISQDVSRLEETVLTLEICGNCAPHVDFRTLTVWNKEKKIHEIHRFEDVFPKGSRRVVAKIVT